MDELRTLGQVVGVNVQRIREDRGLTQAEFARLLAGDGAPFTKATLASLESGRRRDVTLTELVFLAFSLNVLASDLVMAPDDDTSAYAAMSDGVTASLVTVQDVLQGKERKATMVWDRPAGQKMFNERVRFAREEADRAVARKLGISTADVTRIAKRRWQSTLTEERDRRVNERLGDTASPRKIQAVRGHVTRELTNDIEAAIKKGKKR